MDFFIWEDSNKRIHKEQINNKKEWGWDSRGEAVFGVYSWIRGFVYLGIFKRMHKEQINNE